MSENSLFSVEESDHGAKPRRDKQAKKAKGPSASPKGKGRAVDADDVLAGMHLYSEAGEEQSPPV